MTAEVKDIIERLNREEGNVLVEVKNLSATITFSLVPNILLSEDDCIKVYGEEEMCVEFCLRDIYSIHYIEDIDMEMYTLLFSNGLTVTFCF